MWTDGMVGGEAKANESHFVPRAVTDSVTHYKNQIKKNPNKQINQRWWCFHTESMWF